MGGYKISPTLMVYRPFLKLRYPTYIHKLPVKRAHGPTRKHRLAPGTIKLIMPKDVFLYTYILICVKKLFWRKFSGEYFPSNETVICFSLPMDPKG